MIEFLGESRGALLAVRATAKLTTSDYRDALEPRIQQLLNEFRHINVMFLIDEDFDGWTLGAAWANTVLDARHRRDIDKVAMVGAPRWEQWCVERAAALVMRGELKTFRRDQLADARAWLR